MTDFQFVIAKDEVLRYLSEMFAILYDNMSRIAPTGFTRDEDYKLWYSSTLKNSGNENFRYVLILSNNVLARYFQYRALDGVFYMDEIQFKNEFKGSGVFGELYRFIVPMLPSDTKTVQACANKNNLKSQAVLEHLGLEAAGENKNGSILYRGSFENIRNKYGNIHAEK